MNGPPLPSWFMFLLFPMISNSSPEDQLGRTERSPVEGNSSAFSSDLVVGRPKRGYYFYGHPQSPLFDRYYSESEDLKDRGTRIKPSSWGSKMLNKFRDRTDKLLNAASAVAFAHHKYKDEDYEEDNEPAGTFLSWYRSSGRGYGHGHGHGGGGYGKGVNKSAVGLLGFLSLLSLIQAGLSTTTAAPAAGGGGGGGGRRSRVLTNNAPDFGSWPSEGFPQSAIPDIVMPLVSSFSAALERGHSLECLLNDLCSCNRLLVSRFGDHGKDVGIMMGKALESMLKKQRRRTNMDNQLAMKVTYAGKSGRNRKDCDAHYPKCKSTPDTQHM